jgi:hypothetical protein
MHMEKPIMQHSADDGNSPPIVPMDGVIQPTSQPLSPSSSRSSLVEPGFPFEMPPTKVRYNVQNCEDLRSYLRQNNELWLAFIGRFGTKEGTAATDSSGLADDEKLKNFLVGHLKNKKMRTRFTEDYPTQGEGFSRKRMIRLAGAMMRIGALEEKRRPDDAPSKGICLLLEIFLEFAAQELDDENDNHDDDGGGGGDRRRRRQRRQRRRRRLQQRLRQH